MTGDLVSLPLILIFFYIVATLIAQRSCKQIIVSEMVQHLISCYTWSY